jgi:carbamate kinase
METIVIAIGGNALLDPSGRQSLFRENRNIDAVSKQIALLCKNTNRKIIITHGNGSQIGDSVMRNEHSKKYVPKLPLYALSAETQALIGSNIETSLRNNLNELGIKRDACVIFSHVIVGENDPAFKKPSKQIGPFYSKRKLEEELALDKFSYIKSGSKYRRVVASPKPKKILEIDTIAQEAKKSIVITCGGGGVPMVKKRNSLSPVNAVIDKDLTTQLLANSLGAKTLVILTNAQYVYADYKKMSGPIKQIEAKELKKHIDKFQEGTILPKIEACIKFIENGGKEAYIGNIFKLDLILKGKSGTKVV